MRFVDSPNIQIDLLEPTAAPSVGAGEASPAPTVAAIVNAINAAIGLGLHRMPFDKDAIMSAALQI